ncbi:hypothetical protein [Phocaeicola sp.]
MAQPKEISRLQAGASTTLSDGTLLLYGCAGGSFYDYPPTPFILQGFTMKTFHVTMFFCCFRKTLYSKSRFCSGAPSFLFF